MMKTELGQLIGLNQNNVIICSVVDLIASNDLKLGYASLQAEVFRKVAVHHSTTQRWEDETYKEMYGKSVEYTLYSEQLLQGF